MNARTLLVALTLVVLALLTWQLRWVLLVLFGAVVLAVALDVLIEKLQDRLSWPRPLSLAVVLVVLLLGGALVFQLLVPELITQVQELGNLIPTLVTKLKSMLVSNPRLMNLEESFAEQFSWDRIQPLGSQLLGVAGGAANSLIQLLLMSLLAVLLALDPVSHRQMVIAATPRPARQEMAELLDQCRLALGGWLAGMTISASSVFVLTWAGLALLKVPLALLSALVCGLLTFVPTIGPTAASLLPLAMALLVSPLLMLQVLVLRLILQNLEAFLLTPLLLRRTVNLLPTVALMAQLSLGALLGLPGVLLALPLVVVLQVGMEQVVVKQIMDRWA
ncbi:MULTISPECIES: AI-2E family transporter [Prochlorococcus]|uniref:AI-2E family transporter n=1 Tax=Prochlorococcus TaxID=1218 RepID=UPI0007B32F10|nr:MULTISPECIES: AI-2E family transporter [Prochlorococcus]KZR60717.1 pheromone autoinducer 2 transporter [Prochlorococcus marinus str. MIT 1312]KZR79571.1 pheromone autoinducer 2 transporter [Prochlorococcus marinus str. MIT 1327]NMO84693.1 AI-2E family transporter [Prochlorococcus sp. P1344]NMP06718.1 AI-2E family transporter [Prochlorococcus sp. P1361]NMP13675.1 AI-2E family transporter [Prochlorococcus sp.P1363]